MTRTLRRRAFVAGVAVALTLTGCGGGDETASSTASAGGLEKTTIKVGVLPIPDPVALFIANKKGFFKEEGLTVEPVIITGGAAAIPQIKNSSLDIAQTNYVSTFAAVERGEKIKLVADMYQAGENTFNIMVPNDSDIKTVADLKGK